MFDENCIFWCNCCDELSYKFYCCNNSLCNAGGCDMCSPIWNDVHRKLAEISPRIDLELLKKNGTLKISEKPEDTP